MSYPIDATLKDVIADHPADYAAAFGLPTDQPTAVLNVDMSTLSAATDVALGVGEPLLEIADLNFQSGCDPVVDYRIHLYNAAFAHRYHVPVRSILILLRPKADHPNLIGKLVYTAGRTRVQFDYEVFRFWEHAVEPFLHGSIGLLPFATLCKLPPDASIEQSIGFVAAEIHRRAKTETSSAEALKLMTAAFVLAGTRVDQATLAQIFEGYTMLEDSSAIAVAEGWGANRANQRTLLVQGQIRFGEPDAACVAVIKSIKDPDCLDRMIRAILTVSNWQELLDTQ